MGTASTYQQTIDQVATRIVWDALEREEDIEINELTLNVDFLASFFGKDKDKVLKDLSLALRAVNVQDLHEAQALKKANRLN